MPAKSPKGDQSVLRSLNRRNVLNLIRKLGPVSRTQLAEHSGLSSAAITGVTAELITERFLIERSVGEAGPGGGRRPVFLDINYATHFAVGMKITEQYIDAVLTDLSTRVIAHHFEAMRHTEPKPLARQIARICRNLFERGKAEPSAVIGVGLGFAGVVDTERGVVVRTPMLEWDNVPIARLVNEQVGLPTWVDNDVNAFAEAERLFGHGKHASNFLVVAIGRGVGAALVVSGAVYRGWSGGAGEFGHNLIIPGGRLCSCGRRGCLEAYTSEVAILEQFSELSPEHRGLSMDDFMGLVEAGNQDARAILTEAGAVLGRHLSYLVNTLNPELIVFVGEGSRMGDFFFNPLIRRIQFDAYLGMGQNLNFAIVPWYDNDYTPWARGAASLAVEHAFGTAALATGPA